METGLVRSSRERSEKRTARERWDRSKPEIIVAVERRPRKQWTEIVSKGVVVMMDEDYKEKLELEEHVWVLKRVFTTREDLGGPFGCLREMSRVHVVC